jgi:hypothetical protein
VDLSAPLEGQAASDRLAELSASLTAWRPLWSTRPWRTLRVPWEDDHPALAAWLRTLPAERVFALERHADPADELPGAYGALVRDLTPLSSLGALPTAPHPPELEGALARMRDRKAAQVRALVGVAAPALAGSHRVVEWCSGRGHLGRTLARALDRPGLLLERDPSLCAPPADLPEDPRVHHVTVDVVTGGREHLRETDGVVALHACGSLTDRLLDDAAYVGVRALVAAPCCYHRLLPAVAGGDVWRPRSREGRASGLALEHDDLRVLTREATCAGARRTRLRSRELIARAAWDLWRREVTGVDAHHALPPLIRSTFDDPLHELLPRLAAERGLTDPWPAFDALEARARQRVLEVRALDLPRLAARRALELWLNLDRLRLMHERGHRARLGTFCDPRATPRNLALLCTARADSAKRNGGSGFPPSPGSPTLAE